MYPLMAVSGVRSSWLTLARRSDFIRSSSFSSSFTAASFLLDSSSCSTFSRSRSVMWLKVSARICSSSLERMSRCRSKWPSAMSLAPAVSTSTGWVMRLARPTATRTEMTMESRVRPAVAYTSCAMSGLRFW